MGSYKALKQDDLSLIKPWLIYWVVLAIQLTAESYLGFILSALPLYGFVRMLFMLWLVMPQFQGATRLYIEHIEPALAEHEDQIDRFIVDAHKNLRALGSEYLNRLVAAIKQAVLGQAVPAEDAAAAQQRQQKQQQQHQAQHNAAAGGASSYVDMLFSRFRLPGSDGATGTGVGVGYGYSLGAILSSIGSTPLSAAKHLSLPASAKSKKDRIEYLDEQRAKLLALVSSIEERRRDIEQSDESSAEDHAPTCQSSQSKLPKMPSELDFDVVHRDEAAAGASAATTDPATAPPDALKSDRGWLFWGSGSSGPKNDDAPAS